MERRLYGRGVAILAPDGVERVALERLRCALKQAGADTDLLSPPTRTWRACRSPADLPAFCTAMVQMFAGSDRTTEPVSRRRS
jgi:hypothetical protein